MLLLVLVSFLLFVVKNNILKKLENTTMTTKPLKFKTYLILRFDSKVYF